MNNQFNPENYNINDHFRDEIRSLQSELEALRERNAKLLEIAFLAKTLNERLKEVQDGEYMIDIRYPLYQALCDLAALSEPPQTKGE